MEVRKITTIVYEKIKTKALTKSINLEDFN